jgi:Asp-tRNA(Asn)/Glu-tRNA(Gln) amidotransferase A subunit family amidase
MQACLDRTAALEPEVKAWANLDPDHALAQAAAADRARQSGTGLGPLHGIPVGIKDVIDTCDYPTECGSTIFNGYRPVKDSACVAALRAAGAIIMGKTVTTELASLSPSATRNPRNLAHTPGGSSAGSAAAVASGMVPIALGTQTAGSMIRPASFCGVYGFKPTLGLISRRGVLLQSHTLDTIGVMARSIDDIILAADALAVHDPEDPVSYAHSRPRLSDIALTEPPLPPLFAWVRTPAWEQTDPITREAFGELIAELGSRAVEIDMPSLDQAIEAQRIVQAAENAAYYGLFRERKPELLSEALKERLKSGARVAAQDYIRAVNLRDVIYAGVAELLTQFSAILTPAAPGPAPKGLASTGDPLFNGLWTYYGVPAITLPLLEADGLPIGVQLIGARRDDARLLRTARSLVRELTA